MWNKCLQHYTRNGIRSFTRAMSLISTQRASICQTRIMLPFCTQGKWSLQGLHKLDEATQPANKGRFPILAHMPWAHSRCVFTAEITEGWHAAGCSQEKRLPKAALLVAGKAPAETSMSFSEGCPPEPLPSSPILHLMFLLHGSLIIKVEICRAYEKSCVTYIWHALIIMF